MDNDKRKLTEKELKRKNDFEKFNSEMQQKGYKMKNIIINTQQAKPLCLLIMLPFMALVFWIYYNVNGFNLDCLSWGFLVVLLMLVLCLSSLNKSIHKHNKLNGLSTLHKTPLPLKNGAVFLYGFWSP